ncbi:MAG: hypothetical protein VXZ82_11320 [Planctomycetota bacterium]|nr:hypothetical protein [Planctomycetota bacterium]
MSEQLRSAEDIRRIFELLDNVNTAAERADTFKFGMQVGKLLALGWVLGEVPSSDLSLNYEFEDWERDLRAQEDSLKNQLGDLKQMLEEDDS